MEREGCEILFCVIVFRHVTPLFTQRWFVLQGRRMLLFGIGIHWYGMEEGDKIGRFRDESLLISLGLEGEIISSVIGGWWSDGMME